MSDKPQRNRIRFSLRGLFAVVTVAAIGSAALANPTDLWASVVFSGTLGLLVVALLVAVARRSAGAIGFALCGGVYLGLILAPGAETNIVPNLVTSKVLAGLDTWWHPSEIDAYKILPSGGFIGSIDPTWPNHPFQRIGHSLFALLFAIVGSVIARWLYRGEDGLPDSARVIRP